MRRKFGPSLLIALVAGFAAQAAVAHSSGRPPLRVLFLTGQSDTAYHDWRVTTPFLKRILDVTGRFDVRVEEEPRGIPPATLAGYDLLILNYNGPRWGAEAEKAVEEFLRAGKGMVAIHGVNYGPFVGLEMRKNGRFSRLPGKDAAWTAYSDMLGVTWAPENIGHAVRHVFPVKIVDRDHPITRGMDAEFLANDELYHKMDFKPNAHILGAAFSDKALGGTGKEEPMFWTVPFGKGRVFYCPLGHDISAMRQPGFVTLFARAAEWAGAGEVTLPAHVDLDARPAGAVRVLVVTGGHSYPASFYRLFEGHDDIVWSHAASQKEAFQPALKEHYDSLVLHDMYDEIGESERDNLRAFVEAGGGVVAIHHAIVDYTSWPWWYEEVIGGKFFIKPVGGHPASVYKDDVEIVARPAKGMANHPVLRGIGPILVTDEAYRGMYHSPKITVLMETDSPLNDRPVVYLGPQPDSKAVYIQLGHGSYTHNHPAYQKLVYNAMLWSAGRLR